MKTKIMLIALWLIATGAKAQFLGGFFSQQATQRKLMAEQIAGYQVYLSVIKTGYKIKTQGWQNALDLKGTTKDLHNNHIDELNQVQNAIADDPKVKGCRDMQAQIAKVFSDEVAFQQKANQLSSKELAYFKSVNDNLSMKVSQDIAELDDVVTPGKLQLSDEQRSQRIGQLYQSLKDKLAFAGAFTAKTHKLALSRQRAKAEHEQIRKLYGIQ